MCEDDFRSAIVAEALSWVGTPYRNTGRIKGVGVNCAQLLYGVAIGSGAIPPDSPEPKWYTAQLHTHSKDERLIAYVENYGAQEVSESEVGPGDIVLYKTGQSHGHAAIVVEWPERIVHCLPPQGCAEGHGRKEGILAGKQRRFFSLWKVLPATGAL